MDETFVIVTEIRTVGERVHGTEPDTGWYTGETAIVDLAQQGFGGLERGVG